MAEAIGPIDPEVRLRNILGNDFQLDVTEASALGQGVGAVPKTEFSGNPFDDFFKQAIEALDGVSRSEIYANQLIDGYLKGEVELHQVMAAQSKMNLMVQLAVTTINTAVTTFKEITQMQV